MLNEKSLSQFCDIQIMQICLLQSYIKWEIEYSSIISKVLKIVGLHISFFPCLFIVALEAIAGCIGIEAESFENQEKHLRLNCKKPNHEAVILGLAAAAAALLTIAQIMQICLLQSDIKWEIEYSSIISKVLKIVGLHFSFFPCLFIVALEAIAGCHGIEAESFQNQEKHLRLKCKKPNHEAVILGLAAAALLTIAQVIANSFRNSNTCTGDRASRSISS
ncbi:unnamed protein product [Fraxinus pennsylvanica]|uniref:Uncharacterized protein n=1 Tax=Fraxinus pennsylvanica TaxID=56036 RepID=A0AAD2AKU8_9LAMI|nr:unnamed protein product [Fraxinus pennsylvanica]